MGHRKGWRCAPAARAATLYWRGWTPHLHHADCLRPSGSAPRSGLGACLRACSARPPRFTGLRGTCYACPLVCARTRFACLSQIPATFLFRCAKKKETGQEPRAQAPSENRVVERFAPTCRGFAPHVPAGLGKPDASGRPQRWGAVVYAAPPNPSLALRGLWLDATPRLRRFHTGCAGFTAFGGSRSLRICAEVHATPN